METMTRVAVDAMGGDNAPGEIVKGAVAAVSGRSDIEVILLGKKELIEADDTETAVIPEAPECGGEPETPAE